MSTATLTATNCGRPVVREYAWNWDLIMVVMSCLLFWSLAIIALIALV